VRYGGVEALQPISLTIERGGLLLVLGPNGAGKTSLLRGLAGAVPLRSGRVVLAGRDVSRLPAHRRSRAGMALVPEGRGRLPGLVVEQKAVPLPRSRETTIVLRNGRVVFHRDERHSTEELARLYLGERAA